MPSIPNPLASRSSASLGPGYYLTNNSSFRKPYVNAIIAPQNKSVSKEQRIMDSFFKKDRQVLTPKILPAVLQQ